jgi:hypothetical protein
MRAGGLAALATVAVLAGCGGGDEPAAPAKPGPYSGAPVTRAGLTIPARVQDDTLALATGDDFAPRFWPGMNLGVTTPGHHPGELAPTRADYDRWLDGIGRIGARVVRVYTILRPVFYDALAAHNERHPEAPLYFIQGVWIPEEEFLAKQDAYAPAVTSGFEAELADAVAVVHGDADLPERPGHASGRYRTDVARWLLAWSPGIEWDPLATAATDRKHRGTKPERGRYITASADATPMEAWIAARLDHLAGLEIERGWSRPITFTNWLTVDPLEHPTEPLPQEDLVSVDAMHMSATDDWPGGFFASYHAYPYYPDFLSLEPRYKRAKDPYGAYLRELRAHHRGQAVMITEFGVPTGIGVAHRGPLGRDQGDHSEQQAGTMDATMLRVIRDEGYAGGILFEWTDEWFKRTWNTQDIEQPEERRALWLNALTNEEQFGIVAVEPKPPVTLDGKDDEWPDAGNLHVESDAAYLYLLLRAVGPGRQEVTFDVRPPNGPDLRLELGPGPKAQLLQAAWTDHVAWMYGVARHYVPVDRADLRPGSDAWVSPRLILNRPYTVPSTGEKRPTELVDLGELRWGSPETDGRTTVAGDGAVVEVRLPWSMLTFSDPSSHLVYTPRADGSMGTKKVGPMRIEALGSQADYDWDDWNSVEWRERRKAGWDAVAEAFAETAR